jgi:catalase
MTMTAVDDEVKKRHVHNCLTAEPAHGKGVAKAMGIALAEVETEAWSLNTTTGGLRYAY